MADMNDSRPVQAPRYRKSVATVPKLTAAPTTKPCPYCGEEILLVAIKCKHCGEFLQRRRPSAPRATGHVAPPPPASTPVQPIELTGKRFKAQAAICVVLMLAGVSVLFSGARTSSSTLIAFGAIIMAVAGVWGIIVKLLAWWHHG